MNEESQHPQNESEPDPDLQARIVALVLGEASDFERETLVRLMSERSDLAAFRQEIERAHELMQEVGAGEFEAPEDDWKLSADKRNAVLAAIHGEPVVRETPTESADSQHDPHTTSRRFDWRAWSVTAAVCVMGFVTVVFYQFKSQERTSAEYSANVADGRTDLGVWTGMDPSTVSERLHGFDEDADQLATPRPKANSYLLYGAVTSGGSAQLGLTVTPEQDQKTRITSTLDSIRGSISAGQVLPSATYLDDNVELFDEGPEFRLGDQVIVQNDYGYGTEGSVSLNGVLGPRIEVPAAPRQIYEGLSTRGEQDGSGQVDVPAIDAAETIRQPASNSAGSSESHLREETDQTIAGAAGEMSGSNVPSGSSPQDISSALSSTSADSFQYQVDSEKKMRAIKPLRERKIRNREDVIVSKEGEVVTYDEALRQHEERLAEQSRAETEARAGRGAVVNSGGFTSVPEEERESLVFDADEAQKNRPEWFSGPGAVTRGLAGGGITQSDDRVIAGRISEDVNGNGRLDHGIVSDDREPLFLGAIETQNNRPEWFSRQNAVTQGTSGFRAKQSGNDDEVARFSIQGGGSGGVDLLADGAMPKASKNPLRRGRLGIESGANSEAGVVGSLVWDDHESLVFDADKAQNNHSEWFSDGGQSSKASDQASGGVRLSGRFEDREKWSISGTFRILEESVNGDGEFNLGLVTREFPTKRSDEDAQSGDQPEFLPDRLIRPGADKSLEELSVISGKETPTTELETIVEDGGVTQREVQVVPSAQPLNAPVIVVPIAVAPNAAEPPATKRSESRENAEQPSAEQKKSRRTRGRVAQEGKSSAGQKRSLGLSRSDELAEAEEDVSKFKDSFDELMRQRRFAEAELLAKKVREVEPESTQAIVMEEKAKLQKQIDLIADQLEKKSGHAPVALNGVDESRGLPVRDSVLPDAKNWTELTRKRDSGRQTDRSQALRGKDGKSSNRELSAAELVAKSAQERALDSAMATVVTEDVWDEMLSALVRGEDTKQFRGSQLYSPSRRFSWVRSLEVPTKPFGNRVAPPAGLNEKLAEKEAFSTFSLHVSDVSFKLALAALGRGEWPEAAKVRIEEFVNAFDYGDPLPCNGEKVACQVEQSIHPFVQQRNVLRVAMRTAAAGRNSNTPLRLTFVVDNSGSMERADRQQTVRRAFAALAQQLTADDQVTLISFARRPRLLADKVTGDNAGQLVKVIDQLPSEGGTNIEAALQVALAKAREMQSPGAQNRIVLFTDGAVNLGNANPESLSQMVTTMRRSGIAFDAAGISADGLNDEVLEALTRKGDGRYYLLDSYESVDEGFAQQIAGALRPSAKNVKVQVEFNPQRVGRYKLLGFEKHRLKKEDFRNDKVDAAELAAAETGVALYQFEAKPDGEGDVGSVSVRFRDLTTGQMVEHRWPIPYEADAPRPDQAAPSLRIAATAGLLAARLKGEPLGETVNLKALSQLVAGLPEHVRNAPRVQQLQQMIQQARQLSEK